MASHDQNEMLWNEATICFRRQRRERKKSNNFYLHKSQNMSRFVHIIIAKCAVSISFFFFICLPIFTCFSLLNVKHFWLGKHILRNVKIMKAKQRKREKKTIRTMIWLLDTLNIQLGNNKASCSQCALCS